MAESNWTLLANLEQDLHFSLLEFLTFSWTRNILSNQLNPTESSVLMHALHQEGSVLHPIKTKVAVFQVQEFFTGHLAGNLDPSCVFHHPADLLQLFSCQQVEYQTLTLLLSYLAASGTQEKPEERKSLRNSGTLRVNTRRIFYTLPLVVKL